MPQRVTPAPSWRRSRARVATFHHPRVTVVSHHPLIVSTAAPAAGGELLRSSSDYRSSGGSLTAATPRVAATKCTIPADVRQPGISPENALTRIQDSFIPVHRRHIYLCLMGIHLLGVLHRHRKPVTPTTTMAARVWKNRTGLWAWWYDRGGAEHPAVIVAAAVADAVYDLAPAAGGQRCRHVIKSRPLAPAPRCLPLDYACPPPAATARAAFSVASQFTCLPETRVAPRRRRRKSTDNLLIRRPRRSG